MRCLLRRLVDTILTWAVSPFVLGGLCIILAFLLSLALAQRRGYQRDREKIRAEFETFRREVKAKVGLAFGSPPRGGFLEYGTPQRSAFLHAEFRLDMHAVRACLQGKAAGGQRLGKGKAPARAALRVHVHAPGDDKGDARQHFDPQHAVSRLASSTL